MDFAVGKVQRQGEIVGNVFRPQFIEKREVVGAIRIGEPAADRFAGEVDFLHGTGQECRVVQQLKRRLAYLDLVVRPPDEAAPHQQRMQRAHEHRNPPERQTAFDETDAKLLQHILRAGGGTRPVCEPAERRREFRGLHG